MKPFALRELVVRLRAVMRRSSDGETGGGDGDHLRLRYGAQDISPFDAGAYTGDISGVMLAKLGCTYVTVGHSERREHHHESDDVVNAKGELFERVRLPVGRSIAGFGKDGVVYLVSGDGSVGFFIERSRLVQRPR